jgi:DNA-binding ferritin-like protein (Dps family)
MTRIMIINKVFHSTAIDGKNLVIVMGYDALRFCKVLIAKKCNVAITKRER